MEQSEAEQPHPYGRSAFNWFDDHYKPEGMLAGSFNSFLQWLTSIWGRSLDRFQLARISLLVYWVVTRLRRL
jgi:hypothetical protein